MLKTSQSLRCRVIFWLLAASRASALTSQFNHVNMPTGRPESRASPTIAAVPQRAPISNQLSESTTDMIIFLGLYILAFLLGIIVRMSSHIRLGASSEFRTGGNELPELGRNPKTVLNYSEYSSSSSAKLSIVPLVQCSELCT